MSIEVDPLTAFVDVDVSGDVVEVEVVGQGEKGDPGGGAFDGDASDVPYTPATEGDWDPVPAQVAEALDELAGREVGGGAVDSVNGQTDVVVLDAADVGAVATSEVGAPDGVAELDSGGKVPSAQLPSYVDDVVEAANFAALPGTGETGKIYVTLDDNLTFRWSGSAYVEISASLALGETSDTAYRGDRGKTAYDHSQVVTGNPHGTTVGDISGFDEQVRDVIGSALVAGGGITITPNDGADTITIVSAAVLPTIRKPIDATLDAPMLVMGQGWSGGRGYADRTANRIYYTFFTVHTETVVDAYLWGTEGAFAATVYFGIIACTRDGVPASVVHQSNQAVSGASSRIDTFTPVTLQPGNYAIFDVGNNNWRGSYQPTYVPTARRASVPFEYAHYASFTAGPVSGTPPAPTACTAGVSVQSDTVPTITLRRKAL